MSQQFYWTENDGPISSDVDGQPHGLEIVAKNDRVIITVTPFGDKKRQFKILPDQSQLKTLALSLLDASQRVSAVTKEDIAKSVSS